MKTIKIVVTAVLLAGAGGIAYERVEARAAEAAPRTVSRTALMAALQAGPGLREARLVPEMREGQPIGFKLFSVRQDGLLAGIGLRNGDTVTHIGDTALVSAAAAMTAYGRIKEEPRFEIKLLREGKPKTITVVAD